MIAFEKIEEYMMLIDKRDAMNNELEALMYRCLDDHSLLDEYRRKVAEYREFAQQIINFKLK